jgi:hypothetical protein
MNIFHERYFSDEDFELIAKKDSIYQMDKLNDYFVNLISEGNETFEVVFDHDIELDKWDIK